MIPSTYFSGPGALGFLAIHRQTTSSSDVSVMDRGLRTGQLSTTTHQTDRQEHQLDDPADLSQTVDVTVAHGGHRHHQEVDGVPVGDRRRVGEVREVAGVLQEVNNPSPSKPDRDEERDQLGQSDGGRSFENVEILQDVGNTHQSHRSQEPQSYPGPVQVDGDKGWRDGEVVNEGIHLQHEPELVRGGDELK